MTRFKSIAAASAHARALSPAAGRADRDVSTVRSKMNAAAAARGGLHTRFHNAQDCPRADGESEDGRQQRAAILDWFI